MLFRALHLPRKPQVSHGSKLNPACRETPLRSFDSHMPPRTLPSRHLFWLRAPQNRRRTLHPPASRVRQPQTFSPPYTVVTISHNISKTLNPLVKLTPDVTFKTRRPRVVRQAAVRGGLGGSGGASWQDGARYREEGRGHRRAQEVGRSGHIHGRDTRYDLRNPALLLLMKR